MALPPFATLVDAHGAELLAHARRLTDAGRAEDVVQEALLRALRAYPRLRHGDHLRAWLHRITFTVAMDAHRAGAREVLVAEVADGAAAGGADPGTAPTAPAVTAADDPVALAAFEALIADLSGPARDALRLRFVDDLEYDAIAARLDTSSDAARQRVSTAIRTLRQRSTA
jgi:RNA polymerase sigma-70 factor, ECF subfamily